jgi:hypothetical protein
MKDQCSINYQGGGRNGCSDLNYGGLEGCEYDEATGVCHTHQECMCISEYHQCSRQGGCVDNEHNIQLCVSLGCTAAQCRLQEQVCNKTSIMCANQFLQCGLRGTSTSNAANPCYGQCLRTYYRCMTFAGCIQDVDNHVHSDLCEVRSPYNVQNGLMQ